MIIRRLCLEPFRFMSRYRPILDHLAIVGICCSSKLRQDTDQGSLRGAKHYAAVASGTWLAGILTTGPRVGTSGPLRRICAPDLRVMSQQELHTPQTPPMKTTVT